MIKKGFLLFFLTIAAFNVYAAEERYSIEVNVDVTDENASVAQEKAMNEANRAAIIAVAQKLTTQEGVNKFVSMTNEQLVNFIKEVSLIEEKRSPIRYMASLKVVLNEDVLKQYMKERNIPLVTQGEKIIIIPIFREFSSDSPMLWENANLWKQAWDTQDSNGVIRLVSIPTSGTNYSIMDGNKALRMDGEALDKLMRLNGADDVYVLDATYNGIEGLNIKAMSFNGDMFTTTVDGPRSSEQELFNKAATQVQNELQNRLAKKSIDETTNENVIVLLYEYNQLTDWVNTKNHLKTINQITNIQVQAIGNGKIQLKLTYAGNFEKLVNALRNLSYRLIEQNNYFTLSQY